jgi:phosphocarrier protein HPr
MTTAHRAAGGDYPVQSSCAMMPAAVGANGKIAAQNRQAVTHYRQTVIGYQMMQQRTVTITNRLGLHARAAAKLVRVATTYRSSVWLARADAQDKTADAKSIFNVLLLAAAQGTVLEVITEGEDETAAVEALCHLIAEKFGEE